MRLYKAVCAWLEANAAQMGHKHEPDEPHPEGDVYAQAEHAHSYTTEPELHAGYRGISIDYDDESRRRGRIGFQPR